MNKEEHSENVLCWIVGAGFFWLMMAIFILAVIAA